MTELAPVTEAALVGTFRATAVLCREGCVQLTRPGRRRGRRLMFPGRLSSSCAGPLRLSVVLRHVVCLDGTLA